MTPTTTTPELDRLRYPIGRFHPAGPLTPEARREAIEDIEVLPARLRETVAGLTDERLDTPYRPGGWTVRQLVHHVADSHIHSYVRFKLTVTEDRPTILTYDEAVWAEEPDARSGPIAVSLALLDALHERWAAWLRALPDEAWPREAVHPELGTLSLDTLLGYYAWHGRHHVAHVTRLRERSGWGGGAASSV